MKLSIKQKIQIYNSKKDFFIYSINNDKIINYSLSNSLKTYYNKQYTNFKTIEGLKNELQNDQLFKLFITNFKTL